MIDRRPFEPDRSESSFRLMSNIMDLASAAGHCVHAIECATVWRHQAMADANGFVMHVKAIPGILKDRAEAPYEAGLMSLDSWRCLHARILGQASRIHEVLGELRETCKGEPAEHLQRLGHRIVDGENLRAAEP